MSKIIRVATICHNDDDYHDKRHRRVRLELTKEHPEGGYVWRTEYGEDCCLGVHRTTADAEVAAVQAWGSDVWDLRATWRN